MTESLEDAREKWLATERVYRAAWDSYAAYVEHPDSGVSPKTRAVVRKAMRLLEEQRKDKNYGFYHNTKNRMDAQPGRKTWLSNRPGLERKANRERRRRYQEASIAPK